MERLMVYDRMGYMVHWKNLIAGEDGLPSLGRVKLTDLVTSEGLPSDSYKLLVSTLSQSFAQYSASIIQFPARDGALLRSGLDSARFYFHQREAYPPADMIHTNDSREWCKTSGYYADPQLWQETYDFRPGLTLLEPGNGMEFPPGGLPDIFGLLGKAARGILDAISYYLNLRSSPFTEILDNVPLRSREISSSVLSVCCHARPSFHGAQHHNLTTHDDGQLIMFPDHEHQVDKSLISVVKSDKAGLHVRDFHGRWFIVDGDLSPLEAVVYPGLALYQATAGYVNPALHRMEINNIRDNMYGRCSLAFKLMPNSMTSLSCSEMRAAGHGVEAQFQIPVPVDDFMQRSHPTDQLFNRNTFPSFNFPTAQDGSMKPLIRRRKNNTRCKPLPPSKRLRLEAQRVLKERIVLVLEIGWPHGVPFVHPHDLPNKAKIGFLEAYEPGWTATQDMELSLTEPGGQASQQSGNCNCTSLVYFIAMQAFIECSLVFKFLALTSVVKANHHAVSFPQLSTRSFVHDNWFWKISAGRLCMTRAFLLISFCLWIRILLEWTILAIHFCGNQSRFPSDASSRAALPRPQTFIN
ncbi:2-oxoglutarate (2OG) and Fe(II)-dependent oxygenase superfamily protein isoform 1 [Hibiscus syriacus]|uniref:2-oxoglutarate (2OG) and Fe(II)-dependent oxygenase superfamily protein isoform 1 n=1 Tax=Hibiscus syriacus TaxID=106335 RepID=A0A6A2YP47_HIBSY|nr:2-oxoglutarate (2OG) and Fe(II)-dependent oxygenase superfamily protein isoform 1 [Hibiscus syriacus]